MDESFEAITADLSLPRGSLLQWDEYEQMYRAGADPVAFDLLERVPPTPTARSDVLDATETDEERANRHLDALVDAGLIDVETPGSTPADHILVRTAFGDKFVEHGPKAAIEVFIDVEHQQAAL